MSLSLSTSAYSDASRCLKLYQYRHVENLSPKPLNVNPKMRRGTWIHKCLEKYYQHGNWDGVLERLSNWVVERGLDPEEVVALAFEVNELMEQYVAYWQREKWDVLATEESLVLDLGGYTVSATVDKIVRDRQGTWVVEHKSTTEIPPASWQSIDPQTALQCAAAMFDGRFGHIDGVLFDYILTRKPPVPQVLKNGRISTRDITTTTRAFHRAAAEVIATWTGDEVALGTYLAAERARLVNDDLWFQRRKVFRPSGNIRATLRDVWETMQALEAAEQRGFYRRSFHLMTCSKFCQMSELCATEYMTGAPSYALRDAYYEVNAEREGRGW